LFSSLPQLLWEQGTTFFVLLVPHSWTHLFAVICRQLVFISVHSSADVINDLIC